MLGTFILGVAAGWSTPYFEPRVKVFLDKLLQGGPEVGPVELRMVTFAACLLGATILSIIFAEPHAAPLVFGAVVAVIAPRLREVWKVYKAPDYDS
ncbi:MAG: hypothetical protein ACR2O1_02700 [Boseongicola sp.]